MRVCCPSIKLHLPSRWLRISRRIGVVHDEAGTLIHLESVFGMRFGRYLLRMLLSEIADSILWLPKHLASMVRFNPFVNRAIRMSMFRWSRVAEGCIGITRIRHSSRIEEE